MKENPSTSHKKNLSLNDKVDDLINEYFKKAEIPNVFRKSDFENVAGHLPMLSFVLNYQSRSYEFATDNLKDVFGVTAKELLEGGIIKALELFAENERKVFVNQVLPIHFELLKKYAKKGLDVKRIKISYNITMLGKNGNPINTLHVMMPLTIDDLGMPVFGVKYIYDTHVLKNENIVYFKLEYKNEKGIYQTEYSNTFYVIPETDTNLSSRELEILKLVKMGFASKQIANQLNISLNTVNNHRKNIIKKYKAKNLHEVISNSGV